MIARDIMTTHPSVVTPGDSLDTAAQMMRDRHVGMLPVIDNLRDRHLIGVLTDRDVVVRCLAPGHHGSCLVSDHMTAHSLSWVDPDTEVKEVVSKMKEAHVRRVPVLAGGKRLIGVISVADLANRVRSIDPAALEALEQAMSPHLTALRGQRTSGSGSGLRQFAGHS